MDLGRLLALSTTPADATEVFGNQVNHLPAMFGPLLAAVAMRLWVSREGLRGSLGLRRPWRAYAVAVAGPLVFVAAAGLAMVLAGLADFALGEPLAIAAMTASRCTASAGIGCKPRDRAPRAFSRPNVRQPRTRAGNIVGCVPPI